MQEIAFVSTEATMQKLVAVTLLIAGMASRAFGAAVVPEIESATAMSAIPLLVGALLLLRGNKR